MRTLKSLLSALSMILPMSLLLGFSVCSAAAPNVGDPAPDFKLMGSDGNTYTVSQFKGVKPVVIAFFPKAFTGG